MSTDYVQPGILRIQYTSLKTFVLCIEVAIKTHQTIGDENSTQKDMNRDGSEYLAIPYLWNVRVNTKENIMWDENIKSPQP